MKVEALGGAKAEHNAFVVEVEVGEGFGFFFIVSIYFIVMQYQNTGGKESLVKLRRGETD